MDLNKVKKEKGITLIALAVTIVVLLILAGVSLNAVFSQNGIISKAQDAQTKMGDAENSDKTAINNLNEEIDKWVNGNNTSKPFVTDESLTSETRTVTESSTVIAQDALGNQVVVPGGFKIAADSGTTVKEGIVIEDAEENQFVWVPVSNINADGSNKIKVDENTEVEITLGRYIFDETNGAETIVQKGSEYAETSENDITNNTLNKKYGIDGYGHSSPEEDGCYEIFGSSGKNTTAKNLELFINQVKTNKGYYIARYEASYGSGYNESGQNDNEKLANAKPLSQQSENYNSQTFEMVYTRKRLWNNITQPQSAIVCQNMYNNNKYVESDLVNSYAWDTAIVYIQAMGNSNYANANMYKEGEDSIKETGTTGDVKCNIFDLSGNEIEWSTEYNTHVNTYMEMSTVRRGGWSNDSTYNTCYRFNNDTEFTNEFVSFRPIIYVK